MIGRHPQSSDLQELNNLQELSYLEQGLEGVTDLNCFQTDKKSLSRLPNSDKDVLGTPTELFDLESNLGKLSDLKTPYTLKELKDSTNEFGDGLKTTAQNLSPNHPQSCSILSSPKAVHLFQQKAPDSPEEFNDFMNTIIRESPTKGPQKKIIP